MFVAPAAFCSPFTMNTMRWAANFSFHANFSFLRTNLMAREPRETEDSTNVLNSHLVGGIWILDGVVPKLHLNSDVFL